LPPLAIKNMKEIVPYKSLDDAMNALDNGGRFYNLLSKAKDGVITKAELAKVGGLFNDKQKMVLFLEMSLMQLEEPSRNKILLSMEPSLQEAYKKYQPQWMTASEANSEEHLAAGLIVSGVPTLKESKNEFSVFIMVPISTGNATTFAMVPIMDQYDVYELRDESSSDTFLIAHTRGSQKLPERKLKVAGILKELKTKKSNEDNGSKRVFLEAIYHVED